MFSKLITPQIKNYKNFSKFSIFSLSNTSSLLNKSNKNINFIKYNIATKDYQLSKTIINDQFTLINNNRYYSIRKSMATLSSSSSSSSPTTPPTPPTPSSPSSMKTEVVSSISNTTTVENNNNNNNSTSEPTINPIFNNNENNKTLFDKIMKNTYEYPRFSKQWWTEKAYIFIVFGITGTSSLHVVKFLLKYLIGYQNPVSPFRGGLELIQNDPKYVIVYFLTMYTVYPFILISYGTLFGRFQYFIKLFNRMSIFSQLKRLFLKFSKKSSNKKE
ncbi:hypothetical protein DDB_G0273515 [Dictyostelium discoideum AX4]|uniref:Transmembrane protein n=1 Tax=Dictyostelium discoideum TaxID=44689 RepID=Q557J7_DICDI|nr:hypothetical protein DDB_G0273459 [Dictyostelium discoideum AX4]XP_644638.1 hypothetical protein DDB_G0273515 [Dictyostelium discoideum AX4]EAL70684.1 hypothetical protein DDB_G0273459 [Dictyostelium discoideum AX4]EAL70712.1 hypothetical protein DDB_G0273515 [Dictyostelium discoideum AX4]|eukprot:XP_644612.1 hypothetical protein DDB_G0273459 [Dictyostelium discoideum AX4]